MSGTDTEHRPVAAPVHRLVPSGPSGRPRARSPFAQRRGVHTFSPRPREDIQLSARREVWWVEFYEAHRGGLQIGRESIVAFRSAKEAPLSS